MPKSDYRYLITKTASRDLEALPTNIRKRIGAKLQYFIASSEPMHFAEKLTKYQDGDYRFRVGVYRVIFDKKGKTLYILRVQHRKDVYKN